MTFRQIDTSAFSPAELRDQPAPSLSWVDLSALVIDERYQRQITPKGRALIQRIANGWDWKRYQPILIAATTDGRFAVVDGQHRAHAAAVVGLQSLPAMIVPMAPAEQASSFTAVNTERVALNKAAIFKAQLAAGDPIAIEAARLCEEAGCRLMTYAPTASQRKPGDVFVHKLILSMAANGEGEAVIAGLRAIRQSEFGQSADYIGGLRPYDGGILLTWLPAVASSQLFLRLDLAAVVDLIDWETLAEDARAKSRATGIAARQLRIDRVKAYLRAAVDAQRGAA